MKKQTCSQFKRNYCTENERAFKKCPFLRSKQYSINANEMAKIGLGSGAFTERFFDSD